MQTNNTAIQPIAEAIKTNIETINAIRNGKEGMTTAESAQLFLMDKFGYTQIQAQEVCEDLEKGLNDYIANRDAIKADSDATTQLIEKATEACSPEERTKTYVNVLTSLQLISNPDSDAEALNAANSALTDAELVEAIAAALDGLPFNSVMEAVKNGITPEVLASLSDTRAMQSSDFMMAVAVMLYAAQKEGSISLSDDGDIEMLAVTVGAMAGAATDALVATIDLQEGKINISTWQTILKYTLCALFTVAFAALASLLIITATSIICKLIFSVFGFGLLATLIAVPAIFYFTKSNIKDMETLYGVIIEKLSPIYDSLIVKLTSWAKAVMEKVKTFANKAVATVKEKVNAGRQKQDADNSVDTDADPVLA